MVSRFEDLDVYKRAYQTALEVHKSSLGFPAEERFALASQIRRASKSICANIAEGFAKQHKSSAEFKRFVLMAIGSSEEMRVWSSFCKDLGYTDEQTSAKWSDEYNQISKMLNGLMNKWRE
ncbi:MAG TPA: four helix bundle protein [Patescibacteria group bacterium]|nr:four helix bundle protein [Patescibacteria group bacterium]